MPKVQRDNQLLARVTIFIAKSGGCSPAAQRLGVDRVTLWRFAQTGSALARTRERIKEQLALAESETNSISDSALELLGTQSSIPLGELRGIRKMCERMLAWVDKMEPQMLAVATQRASAAQKRKHGG